MKSNQPSEIVTDKAKATKTDSRDILPRNITALRRVVEYLAADAEADYKQTPKSDREMHIYPEVRRLETWLTELLPPDGGRCAAMLPSLGDVRLTRTGWRLIPQEKLDEILQLHFMHRWDNAQLAAMHERDERSQEVVSTHQDGLQTDHYMEVAGKTIKATVGTKVSTTTTITACFGGFSRLPASWEYIHVGNNQNIRKSTEG